MYMNAYHKVQGEVRMFEVDARGAIARYPEEWSAEPWVESDGSADWSINRKAIKKSADSPPDEKAGLREALKV